MRRLIGTLLAATMLLPVAASAQDRDGRWRDRGSRAEGAPRGDMGRGMGEARQRPWRDQMQPADGSAPDPRPRFDRGAAPRPDLGNTPRVEDGRGNDGRGNWGGGNAGRWNNGGRTDRDGRDWRRGGVDDGARYGIPGRDRSDDRRDDPRGWNGQRDPNRGYEDRRYADDRRDEDRRYGDARRYEDRRYDDARRYDDRRGFGTWYSDRDGGNRGGWNRGWRGESRYDWSRYRAINRNAYRLPRYYAPSGWGGGYRRFGIGTRLASGLWGQNYWIDDPFVYRLPEAYGPYRWVRYYGDALLIDLRTGLVVDTVYDIFW